jgi:soluble lytic murein transglycosylase
MRPKRLGSEEQLTKRRLNAVAWAPAGLLVLTTAMAAAPPFKHVPLPRPRPASAPVHHSAAASSEFRTASLTPATEPRGEPALPVLPSLSASDLSAVKQAIDFSRHGKSSEATEVEHHIEDPAARKLVEWVILRSDDNNAVDSTRYHAFVAANPNWPNILMFRRRAEAMLWQEHADLGAVRAILGNKAPMSAKGRFALGRALLALGDQSAAQAAVREAWRNESLSRDLEEQVLETFGGIVTRADDKARMDRQLYAGEHEVAFRAAQRLGGDAPSIVRTRIAVEEKSKTAKGLLDGLPESLAHDPVVMFTRIQWLRREERITEAAQLLLAAPRDPAQTLDADQWWIERRLIARKLLDLGDFATAYKIVREVAPPTRENYRVEQEFTSGWIALRFLNEPAAAAEHFARMAAGITNPIALARSGYWRGRAAEAMKRTQEARAQYEQAARYSTAYYGQLARAKFGMNEIALAPPPLPSAEKRAALARIDVVQAAEILYTLGERDLVIPIMADIAERTADFGTLAALAEVATQHQDARSVLLIGKAALGRGYPFDHYAFPTFGLPQYTAIGPQVEPAVVYAIARQESAFNPKDVSSAHALGLMQVTPEAGRYVAKKFNVTYDQNRLLHDNVYNMQIGAAELGDDISAYRGSYILAFAGYNAGRGRVHEWVERYGDPRDPKVDPVDWVERIPFAETRNYVQRILENVQVYRARFGGGTRLMIEADLHRGSGD